MVLLASQIFEECFKSEGISVFLGWKMFIGTAVERRRQLQKKITRHLAFRYAVSLAWYQR